MELDVLGGELVTETAWLSERFSERARTSVGVVSIEAQLPVQLELRLELG